MSISRWSKNFNLGDCKTCLCRISPSQKTGLSSAETNNGSGHEEQDTRGGGGGAELSDSQMSSQLLGSMKTMRDEESLCDVTLSIENTNTRVPAHKIVLAAASPYFRKMFSCGLKESQNGEVKFHDLSPDVLVSVVNFIYTGKIKIDEHLVDGLLDAGDMLQLPSLRNLCLWWLMTNLTPSSCLGIFVLAQLRLHLDLAETAKEYTIEHFREVMEGEEWTQLSPEHLEIFLDEPYLGCENDGQLLKALLEWTNHDSTRRTPHLISFLDKIDLVDVLPQVLIEVIQHPVVTSAPAIERTIRSVLTNLIAKKFDTVDIIEESEEEIQKPPRLRCFHQQDVIFGVGGESQGQSLSNVECFMMGYDGWKCSIPRPLPSTPTESSEMSVIPTMKQCRYYPATASQKHSLFVIGGQDCGFPVSTVEKYNILENRWTTLCPLPISVHGCGAALVNRRLYVVGGRSSEGTEKRVWLYNEESDCWAESLPMSTHRAHVGVCSGTGELYAIGGIGGRSPTESSFLSSGEKFDPITGGWIGLAPMHEERAFHSTAVMDCHVYAMGGSNGKMWLRTVERFDMMCGQWSKVSNMSIPRSSFGTTVTSGRIYCLGGYDGVHFLNTVEKYNPRTDRWHCVHAMQIERYGLIGATLGIPLKSHLSTMDSS